VAEIRLATRIGDGIVVMVMDRQWIVKSVMICMMLMSCVDVRYCDENEDDGGDDDDE
jgi:hypothetical protein